ncbi:MAG: C40 family peptidase [Clostridiales bacterium]|nr:C40 family peptidase [Clostridiales bacterium]
MRQRRRVRNSKLAAMAIAMSAIVTLPVLLVPIGLRKGTPAGVRVARAYADLYSENDDATPLVEEWAISAKKEEGAFTDPDDEDFTTNAVTPDQGSSGEPVRLKEGETITSSYENDPEHEEKKYDSVLTAQIEQVYDSADLPVEILDPSTFTPTDEDMYISTNKTILKELPDMDSTTVADIDRSAMVTRIARGSTWSLVRTKDGVKGYVLNKSLSWDLVFNDIDRTVWVNASELKLRSEASTDSKVIKTLKRYTKLHCTGVANNEWYRVTTPDGEEGYVYVSYTTTKAPPTPTSTPTPTPKPTEKPKSSSSGSSSEGSGSSKSSESSGSSSGSRKEEKSGSSSGSGSGSSGEYVPPKISGKNGESVISIAKSMLGVKYDWCGESRSGVDCSGLCVYCYRQLNVELTHQSDSIRYQGTEVSREDIRVGDIIVYDLKYSDGKADHVALYAGDGQVIHASYRKGQVVWGNMDMGTILTIRRIFT